MRADMLFLKPRGLDYATKEEPLNPLRIRSSCLQPDGGEVVSTWSRVQDHAEIPASSHSGDPCNT